MTPPVQRTIFAPFNRTILASFYRSIGGCFLALACGVGLPCARLGGREAALTRRYRPGQRSVYQMEMHTQATVETQPPGLEAFLPALPTDVSTRQQNTVIVRAVHADGSADVEHRFDRFELQSNLAERSPKERRVSGQQGGDHRLSFYGCCHTGSWKPAPSRCAGSTARIPKGAGHPSAGPRPVSDACGAG